MKRRCIMVAALMLVTAGGLAAHDLFIKLNTYFLTPGSRVAVPILNGTFEVSENSITADRLLNVGVITGGKTYTPPSDSWVASEDQDTTYLNLQTSEAGTYVIGVSTRHRDIELAAADFNEYLEHDGVPDVLEQRRRNGELEKDAWERYSKHVKAIVQVGDERTDDYDAEFGHPAEIVALVNPYELSVGGEIVVRCLVDGQPVTGQLVIAGGQNALVGLFEERESRTDSDGIVRFTLDQTGRWYIKFINMVEHTSNPDIDYQSKWATLTFEIR